MREFMKDFKAFAMKGNVMDMAIGVVMGTAFGAIVTALVQKIIMPLVGILVGGIDLSGLALEIGTAKLEYGAFLQAVLNFLIIAFSIFLFVRAIARAKKKFEKEELVEEEKPEITEVQLLTEIKELLEKKVN